MAKKDVAIPPHFLEGDLSAAQKKVYGKAVRAEKKAEKETKAKKAKRSGAKSVDDGGYGSGAGKEDKP